MQPYFFPYIGYWQLINAVDTFVIYDDVNYIKQGWINRNKILENGVAKYFNLLLKKASSNKLINEIAIIDDSKTKKKMLKRLHSCYCNAPYFNESYAIIKKIIYYENNSLSNYLKNHIEKICDYLTINTKIIMSSDLKKDNSLRKQNKILEICQILNEKIYINPIGGKELYKKQEFSYKNISLFFLDTKSINYKQFSNEFVPNLSIIDILMFNSEEKVKKLLEEYTLL